MLHLKHLSWFPPASYSICTGVGMNMQFIIQTDSLETEGGALWIPIRHARTVLNELEGSSPLLMSTFYTLCVKTENVRGGGQTSSSLFLGGKSVLTPTFSQNTKRFWENLLLPSGKIKICARVIQALIFLAWNNSLFPDRVQFLSLIFWDQVEFWQTILNLIVLIYNEQVAETNLTKKYCSLSKTRKSLSSLKGTLHRWWRSILKSQATQSTKNHMCFYIYIMHIIYLYIYILHVFSFRKTRV